MNGFKPNQTESNRIELSWQIKFYLPLYGQRCNAITMFINDNGYDAFVRFTFSSARLCTIITMSSIYIIIIITTIIIIIIVIIVVIVIIWINVKCVTILVLSKPATTLPILSICSDGFYFTFLNVTFHFCFIIQLAEKLNNKTATNISRISVETRPELWFIWDRVKTSMHFY